MCTLYFIFPFHPAQRSNYSIHKVLEAQKIPLQKNAEHDHDRIPDDPERPVLNFLPRHEPHGNYVQRRCKCIINGILIIRHLIQEVPQAEEYNDDEDYIELHFLPAACSDHNMFIPVSFPEPVIPAINIHDEVKKVDPCIGIYIAFEINVCRQKYTDSSDGESPYIFFLDKPYTDQAG